MRQWRTKGERNLIVNALGDTPETAIPAHLLRRRRADETCVIQNGLSGPLD